MNTIDSVRLGAPSPPEAQAHKAEAAQQAAHPELESKKAEMARAPLAKAEGGGKPGSHEDAAPPAEVGARVTLSVDLQLKETIIKVVDPASGEVLRQIPEEEVLRQRRAYESAQTDQQARPGGQKPGKDGGTVA